MSDALYDEESFSVFKRSLRSNLDTYATDNKSDYSAFKRLRDNNIVGLENTEPLGIDFPTDGEDSVALIADDRKNFIRELTKYSGGYINPAALPVDPFERQLSALPNIGDLDAKPKEDKPKEDVFTPIDISTDELYKAVSRTILGFGLRPEEMTQAFLEDKGSFAEKEELRRLIRQDTPDYSAINDIMFRLFPEYKEFITDPAALEASGYTMKQALDAVRRILEAAL